MLHTVNKSPYEKNSFATCIRLANEGSSILLIEDAVYAALDNTKVSSLIKENLNNFKFYVLDPDLKARGLDKNFLIPNIEIISYKGFVKLTVVHEKTQTWL